MVRSAAWSVLDAPAKSDLLRTNTDSQGGSAAANVRIVICGIDERTQHHVTANAA